MSFVIENARVLLPDDVIETDVLVADGLIQEIGGREGGGSFRAERRIDGRGLLLAPAMIDIHGDAFERQLMPRPNVFFPIEAALLDTDRQLATNGIATAYHALTLSWEPGLRSVSHAWDILRILRRLQARLTVENRLQLRWETFAFEAVELIRDALGDEGAPAPAIAFNDHTSMSMRDRSGPIQERLFEHNPDFKVVDPNDPSFPPTQDRHAARAGLSIDEYVALLKAVWARRPDVPGMIAEVAAMGRERGVPMLSHDDSQNETREHYRNQGAGISEFPMRLEVAEAARAAGDAIVFGAPNVVRGGSHIGSPAAADMVEAGLCDVLASDYFYPAMLAAVGRLVDDKRSSLHEAWALVSSGPAKALHLNDRGTITPGLRADLVLIDWPAQATPAVKMTMSCGEIAYLAR
jgi:alpha-D-ribose 1-methylphosphonate 5-triphosphate diphosphatase